MSGPSTVNGPAKTANEIIKGAIDVAGLAAKAALVVAVPFFGLPIVSTLTNFAIDYLCNLIYEQLGTYATFLIIDFQTIEERNAYVNAIKLLSQAPAQGVEHEKALQEARDRLKKLINFDGSNTP